MLAQVTRTVLSIPPTYFDNIDFSNRDMKELGAVQSTSQEEIKCEPQMVSQINVANNVQQRKYRGCPSLGLTATAP